MPPNPVVILLWANACVEPTVPPKQDVDSDGFISEYFGGDDCDDRDANVHPGATEIWYDGANSNCDLASDFDQDGDGYDAAASFGDDCDDLDPDVLPGALEVYDGADNDCDGLADDGLLAPGVLLITEVMSIPTTDDVRLGQWIEVHNTSAVAIQLGGWALSASGEALNPLPDLRLNPGARLVLGATDNPDMNGGLPDPGVWGGTTSLAAPLTLWAGDLTIDVASWPGVPTEPGVSVARDTDGVWCRGTGTYGDGQIGTPGEPNTTCEEVAP